jgi:hypothetical protein
MNTDLWRWDAVALATAIRTGRVSRREDLALDAAEVIEARHRLPTPIDPAP